MPKIKSHRRLWFKRIGLTIYSLWIAALIVTGVEVRRINQDYAYVITTHAKTIEVDDLTYFYREVGVGNTETILMIHGFLGSSYDFIEVMEALQDRYHVVAVDLIGFGLSEKSLTFHYSKQNQADHIKKFLDALGLPQVILMAHSMGGEVSFHLAHDYPSYVKEMILIGSGGYYLPQGGGLMPTGLPLFFYDYVVQNYFVQRTFFFTAYANEEVQSQLVTQKDFDEMYIVNQTIPAKVLRKFTADNDSGSTNAKLASIQQPVLLIWGLYDSFIPISTGELLANALGDQASMVVMNRAGHLPFDTYFDDFMVHVETFLQRANP
jgi:pimeloyl-ACP methyl ester carboxylesterase